MTRRERLPSNWQQIRRRVIRRDAGLCQWPMEGGICAAPGKEVDHRTAGDNHHDTNLWLLCRPHHYAKTGAENSANMSRRRPSERHPGDVRPGG